MPFHKNAFAEFLQNNIVPEFNLHSRVHRLNSYINSYGSAVFIKRDDELSSGITGSKFRKYASLLKFFIEEKFDEIAVIGSAQSNNVVGLLQLLNENAINAKLFLLEANEAELKGNLLWLNLLHDIETVTWIRRDDWKNVNEIANEYAVNSGKKVFVLYEGGAVAQALPGAMTLAYDILENEKQHNLEFDHIFIDSGSGTTAIGFLLGLAMAGIQYKTVHITLIAGTENEFTEQYKKLSDQFFSIYGIPEKYFEGEIIFSRSLLAPSFGSITQSVLNELHTIAKTEGILMEPVYSVKHFFTAKHIIETQKLKGNILIINSGGSLGISGFQGKLAKGLLQD